MTTIAVTTITNTNDSKELVSDDTNDTIRQNSAVSLEENSTNTPYGIDAIRTAAAITNEINEETTNTTTTSHKNSVCQECHEKQFLYQCPRCMFRSCSLECCLQHKQRMKCNGKRDLTQFIPLYQMNDTTLLQNDYHFLENVITPQVTSSKRLLSQITNDNSDENNNNNKRRRQQYEKSNMKNENAQQQQPHPLLVQLAEVTNTTSRDKSDNTLSRRPIVTVVHQEEMNDIHPQNNNESKPSSLSPFQRQTSSNTSNIIKNNTMFQRRQQKMVCSIKSNKWRKFHSFVSVQRNTNVIFMPEGMERHKLNNSHISKTPTTASTATTSATPAVFVVNWTIEWRMHHHHDDHREDPNNDNNTSSSHLGWKQEPKERLLLQQNECQETNVATSSVKMNQPSSEKNNNSSTMTTNNNSNNTSTTKISKSVVETEIVWDYLLKNMIFIKNSNDNEKNRCEEVKEQYALLMKQLPCRSNEIQYIEIMYHETVQEILTDRTIIEFPTFEIVPNHLLYLFPRRIKN